jgi:hypothetical protein
LNNWCDVFCTPCENAQVLDRASSLRRASIYQPNAVSLLSDWDIRSSIEWTRGRWLTSSRNKSISMDLIGLNDMVLVGHWGRRTLSTHSMRDWSEMHTSLSTCVDAILFSVFRERTKSRVCPLLWVGWWTCYRKPTDSMIAQKRWV